MLQSHPDILSLLVVAISAFYVIIFIKILIWNPVALWGSLGPPHEAKNATDYLSYADILEWHEHYHVQHSIQSVNPLLWTCKELMLFYFFFKSVFHPSWSRWKTKRCSACGVQSKKAEKTENIIFKCHNSEEMLVGFLFCLTILGCC